MYFAFTPEQESFREMIRDFIKRECPPDLDRKLDDEARYPHELTPKVVETGLLGLPFGEEYGGSGGGVMEFVIAAEELAYGSAAVAAIFILPAFFAGEMINMNGSEEQKKEWLPKIARGEIRGESTSHVDGAEIGLVTGHGGFQVAHATLLLAKNVQS